MASSIFGFDYNFISISATVTLRLLLIGVPVMSQKLVAKQSQYKKELDEFRSVGLYLY